MIMAIQSDGYTCFPMRSLKSRKDSIRKSCSRQERASVWRESLLKTFAGWAVCVCVPVFQHLPQDQRFW